MTVMGPYNSPMALAVRPWGALFWSLWAAFVVPTAIYLIFKIVAPDFYNNALTVSSEFAREFWFMLLVAHGATLVLMMAWAEYAGAGPFAGEMRINANVVALAAIGGPFLLIGSTVVVAMLFANGDPNWAVRGDIDLGIYSLERSGILLIAFVVLVAPVLEEVAFRGIGMGCLLARQWDPAMVIGMTAFIFTLTHTQYQPLALIPIFITGVFLGWLRVRTGTVAAPLIAHMSANACQLIL